MNLVKSKILFFFETAAGLGHMRRTSAIVNALIKRGADVTVASGSFQSPEDFFDEGVNLLRLNPLIGRNGDVRYRFDEKGGKHTVLDYDEDKWKKARNEIVKKFIKENPVHAIIAEYWPFSRQSSFNGAIRTAVKWNHKAGIDPVIISSARDILHTKIADGKEDKKTRSQEERAIRVIREMVDYILVHGDPRIVRFEEGFSNFDKIKKIVEYTGFVVSEIERLPKDQREKKVIVSVGAGTVGKPILQAVFNAQSLIEDLKNHKWVYVLGPRMIDAHRSSLVSQFDRYNSSVSEKQRIEYHDYITNLPQLLGTSDFSISMGGYNTTFEVLASGIQGAIIPKLIKEGPDKFSSCPEQAGRARRLQTQGLVSFIEGTEISDPKNLAKLLLQAFRRSTTVPSVNFDGASKTADLVLDKIWRRFKNTPIPDFPKIERSLVD